MSYFIRGAEDGVLDYLKTQIDIDPKLKLFNLPEGEEIRFGEPKLQSYLEHRSSLCLGKEAPSSRFCFGNHKFPVFLWRRCIFKE